MIGPMTNPGKTERDELFCTGTQGGIELGRFVADNCSHDGRPKDRKEKGGEAYGLAA
jgi:hypothetical protein